MPGPRPGRILRQAVPTATSLMPENRPDAGGQCPGGPVPLASWPQATGFRQPKQRRASGAGELRGGRGRGTGGNRAAGYGFTARFRYLRAWASYGPTRCSPTSNAGKPARKGRKPL